MSNTRTDVPINLHPQALDNLADHLDIKDTVGAEAIAAARGVMQHIHDGYAAINDAETALRKASGQKRIVNGREQFVAGSEDLGKAATNRYNAIAPSVDGALKRLGGIQQVLESRIATAITDPNGNTAQGIALATEMRAHVKSLGAGERLEFIRQAVVYGDKRTVSALLNGPAYLSGLDAGMLDNLREQASHKFAPQDHVQLAALRELTTKVGNAGSVLLGRMQRAVEAGKNPKAAADAAIRELASGQ
jgi:hypothetical protein